MSDDKKTGSNSWERADGYKPEWAREFDTDTPNQRSDSESFDRAVEMGVEAAEALEREKLRASSPSPKSKKPQTKEKQSKKPQTTKKQNKGHHAKAQEDRGLRTQKRQNKGSLTKRSHDKKESISDTSGTLGTALYMLFGIGLIAAFAFLGSWVDSHTDNKPSHSTQRNNSSYSTQKQHPVSKVKEPSSIQPEKQDDGSYHAHVELGSTPGRVKIPTEVARSFSEPWVMRVRGDIGESSFSTCMSQLMVHKVSRNYWDRIAKYPDWCEETKEHAFERWASFPTELNRGMNSPVALDFYGWNARLDIDFLPISAIAVQWNTSEPLKGSDSTFVAFSGSLEGLKLSFGSARVSFRVYNPTNGAYLDLTPYDVPDVTENFSTEAKAEVIKKLGFDRDDASGYIFVDVKESAQSGSSWWQLN
ncbi:MAG: hypothetical protein IKS49_00235 [Actinomycetaceae bacterium]|nr:hypothetical protein [Actinomycetaceae bacterium]